MIIYENRCGYLYVNLFRENIEVDRRKAVEKFPNSRQYVSTVIINMTRKKFG